MTEYDGPWRVRTTSRICTECGAMPPHPVLRERAGARPLCEPCIAALLQKHGAEKTAESFEDIGIDLRDVLEPEHRASLSDALGVDVDNIAERVHDGGGEP